MASTRQHSLKLGIILFSLGFAGVISVIPLIPALLALQPEKPPIPIFALQILSTLQSSVILAGCIALGIYFTPRVALDAPIIRRYIEQRDMAATAKNILVPGILGGVIGGIALLAFFAAMTPLLPADFLANAEKFSPPWYTRLLYGGITEEILMRWGLMSFFVWLSFRTIQAFRTIQGKAEKIHACHYMIAILVSALLFALGHLPAASMLSSELTPALVFYIITGNTLFGIIAGLLFWRHGLECAILAHMVCHVIMIISA